MAAAYNQTLNVRDNSGEGFDITLTAGAENNLAALYDGDYQTSTGAKISLGEALSGMDIVTDADVWHRDGNELYVSLNRPVRVYAAQEEQSAGTHLTRVNLPAMISSDDAGASVKFSEGGLMEVAVSGDAYTTSEGWAYSKTESGETLFTCYDASPRTINITFGEEA